MIRLGHTVNTFSNPVEALEWLEKPGNIANVIMTDVMMPEMDGIEFVRSVRSFPATARTPVIMLTGQTDIESKIAGLQAGADDYLSKSVSPTELELRLKALLSRSEATAGTIAQSVAKTISVFSLRGGVGKTSIAVNFSIALTKLWGIEVTLWDMALSSGHCASFLNVKSKNTLASLHEWPEETVEEELLEQLLIKHASGISLVPAPESPSEAELVTNRTIDLVWPYFQGNSSYLVVDAGSQFSEPVMTILERSDMILLVLAPEIASVKSAGDALAIFEQLGYDLGKVLLVINNIFPSQWLTAEKIAPVLKKRTVFEIPYDSDGFVRAIITGEPLVNAAPKSASGLAVISLAYKLGMQQLDAEKQNHSSPLLDWIRKQRS